MRKYEVTLARSVFLAIACLWSVGTAFAKTYLVPTQVQSIQAAIDSASTCDTILVMSGTYHETLDTQGKWVVIKSVSGPISTILDALEEGSVVTMHGGGILEGFTVRNGLGEFGGGVYVWGDQGSSGAIIGNIIESNTAGLAFDFGIGGGVYIAPGIENFEIRGNRIQNNYAGDSGGGIFNHASFTLMSDNIIADNGCHVEGGGVRLLGGYLVSNLIADNWSDNVGGGVSGGGVTIENNTIVRNSHNNFFAAAAGVNIDTGTPIIRRNIIAGNFGQSGKGNGIGLFCGDGSPFGTPRIECNDVWGNDGGDYVFGGSPCDSVGGGNLSLNPLFCDEGVEDFTLMVNSPCAASNNACGQIGVYDVGCGGTSVERISWGRLKTLEWR